MLIEFGFIGILTSAALAEKLNTITIRSMNLKNIIKYPKTIEEAANRFLIILTDAELQKNKNNS